MKYWKIFHQAVLLVIFSILSFQTVVSAEIQVYEGVGEYFVNDETIEFAKRQAELIAERDILEKVAFYIKSNSIILNSELIEDEVITIAVGILCVIDTKFHIESGDSVSVKSLITAKIDINELERLLKQAIREHKGE